LDAPKKKGFGKIGWLILAGAVTFAVFGALNWVVGKIKAKLAANKLATTKPEQQQTTVVM
jgi:hypothetical protein